MEQITIQEFKSNMMHPQELFAKYRGKVKLPKDLCEDTLEEWGDLV